MKTEERDNATQRLIDIRNKIRDLERNFKETLELIEEYKVLTINAQIDDLKEKKKERWWDKWP